ncbi:MAG TPA: hypothetical protein VJP40_10155 [bacterium]|nr:hypothetical protein [bacterium]
MMKFLGRILIAFFTLTLAACSSSGDSAVSGTEFSDVADEAPSVPPVPVDDFRERFVRWSEFAGAEPNFDEGLQLLRELQAADCCKTAEHLRIYIAAFVGKDRPTQRLVEEMRRENAALFNAFECLKFGASNSGIECPTRNDASFDQVQLEELKLHSEKLTELAVEARERILAGAKIIGFDFIATEELNSEVEIEFTQRFNRTVDQVLSRNPDLTANAPNFRVSADLLRAVTLHVESGDFSFFQFLDVVIIAGDDAHGGQRVVPAAENPALPELFLHPMTYKHPRP